MDAPNAQMYNLFGKRYISTSEPKNGVKFSSDEINKVTGNDPYTVRSLHGKPMTFPIVGLLNIQTNNELQMDKMDNATAKRPNMVVYPYTFEELNKDDDSDDDDEEDGVTKVMRRQLNIHLKPSCATAPYRDEFIRMLFDLFNEAFVVDSGSKTPPVPPTVPPLTPPGTGKGKQPSLEELSRNLHNALQEQGRCFAAYTAFVKANNQKTKEGIAAATTLQSAYRRTASIAGELDKIGILSVKKVRTREEEQEEEEQDDDVAVQNTKKAKTTAPMSTKFLNQIQALSVRARKGDKEEDRALPLPPFIPTKAIKTVPQHKEQNDVTLLLEFIEADSAGFPEAFRRYVGYFRVGYSRTLQDPTEKKRMQARLSKAASERNVTAFNSICDKMARIIPCFGWGILTSPLLLKSVKAKVIENLSAEQFGVALTRFLEYNPKEGEDFDELKHNATYIHNATIANFVKEQGLLLSPDKAGKLTAGNISKVLNFPSAEFIKEELAAYQEIKDNALAAARAAGAASRSTGAAQ
ncbi:hypothetical protein HKX48_008991 [Thoreauomyces humboldtii]|nr:hypothetical protein HKX48_008991 [Thoreauomyces humboldtii]